MNQPTNIFLVLAFEHPLDAVQSVAERIAAGLCCHGLNAVVCTLPRDGDKLAQLPPASVCGVLSMGPLPLAWRIGSRALWEHFEAPVTSYQLDALPYDLVRVPVMGEFLAAAQRDPRLGLASPEDGYRRWLGPALGVRWQPLPFGAFARVMPAAAPVAPQDRWCIVGTIGSELGGSPIGETLPALLQRVLAPLAGAPGCARVADALLAADAHPMPARTVATTLAWDAGQVLQPAVLAALVAVDSWVKRERRIAAVRSLAGVGVDFFGSGWAAVLGDVPGFRHVGNIRHDDIASLLPHYRGIVNFDPNWQHGVHDRVYTAVAMGVPVLSNDNTALDGAALPRELLLRYDANRPDLAGVIGAAGHTAAPLPSRPRAELLARHNWAARLGPWLAGDAVAPSTPAADRGSAVLHAPTVEMAAA